MDLFTDMAAASVKRSIYMQISCFVNANGFFSRTNYVKKPTDSHDLTFRTFITAISHLHFKQTVCSILRNKLTKNFRSFYILNLRLQRQDQHVKDVNFFVYN